MDVGLLLPYFLLSLVMIDEHYAMWFIFFFIIPLLDVMFYVETPNTTELYSDYWYWLCLWMWFPSVVFCMICCCSPTWQSMLSFGVLYNSLLCVGDELKNCPYGLIMERLISDYLGLIRWQYLSSILRSIGFFYLFLLNKTLLWHLGSVCIGSILYEYVHWIEDQNFQYDVSHYGLSNYAMFHFQGKLLPVSHVWAFFYLKNGLKE